jgi:hypothetical protein
MCLRLRDLAFGKGTDKQMRVTYLPGRTNSPQQDTFAAELTLTGQQAVSLAYNLFKPKVGSTRPDALEFRDDRLQALLDNFDELIRFDPESTELRLVEFSSADFDVEEDDGFIHPQEYNRAVFKNNQWDIVVHVNANEEEFSVRLTQNPRWNLALPIRQPFPAAYRNLAELQLGATAVEKAFELAGQGRNLRLEAIRRREHAQGLAELNAHMARKNLALPLEVLGETFSFLEPFRPHPTPGHAKRRAEAKRMITKERQESLTRNQMEYYNSLSPEEREAAYAALGGRSKRNKRGKRSKRGKRTQSKRSKRTRMG